MIRTGWSAFLSLALSVGCAPTEPALPHPVAPAVADVEADHQALPFPVTDPSDADQDGIPDQLEDYLISQFAPEVRLAPATIEWTRPANVHWYLPLVGMGFLHRWCPDHEVMVAGTITTDNIWRQQHPQSSSLCSHARHLMSSGSDVGKSEAFFLTAARRAVWHGIPESRSDEWQVYAHVKPSSYVRASDHRAAAYDIQIWFFYAYNLGTDGFNHEADWEHMTVSVSSDFAIVSVYFSAHSGGRRIDRMSELSWVDRTHPVGYSARGTHASYPVAGKSCGPATDDLCYDDGPRWQTWKNFVNLGERGRILNGQDWARFDGRWGQFGWFGSTSGPVGPMFNRRWTIEGSEYPLTPRSRSEP